MHRPVIYYPYNIIGLEKSKKHLPEPVTRKGVPLTVDRAAEKRRRLLDDLMRLLTGDKPQEVEVCAQNQFYLCTILGYHMADDLISFIYHE